VAGAALALPCSGLATAPAAAAEAGPDPLLLDITRVSPATVPSGQEGMVRIAGTVTNLSTSPFTRVNIHPVTSDSPITDPAALAAAALTDADTYVGDRVTTPGAFDTIDVLEPGEAADFRITVSPADLELGTESGVYWLGVHALGDGATPRDAFADGRARTFIPLLPGPPGDGPPGGPQGPGEPPGEQPDPQGPPDDAVPSALVVPLRADVRYAADGSVRSRHSWTRSLSEGGRLHDLLDVAATNGRTPLTWLVDPAVPDAVARLAAGNPPRSLAPPDSEDEEPSETATPSPTEATTEGSDEDEEDGGLSDAEQRTADVAQAWLETFTDEMTESEVLALPFGDVDVSSAAAHDPQVYRSAVRRSAAVLQSFGVDSVPAVASPGGVMSPQAVAMTPQDTVVLMPDDAFATEPTSPSGVVDVGGKDVVVTSSGAAAGGPGPGDRFGPLALRQRILSEAALRRLGGDQSPLVTVLPDAWHPDDASALFRTGPVEWFDPVTLGDVTSSAASEATPEAPPVVYTAADRNDQLPAYSFTAATAMARPALLLDGILTDGSTLPQQVEDEALTTLSYDDRARPRRAADRAEAARREVAGLLEEIDIQAPPSATLSSASGSIGTTLVNGLDQSVTVRVDVISDDDLEIADHEGVELGPTSRAPLILEVTTRRIGIHDVRLVVTDEEGRPLGSSTELPIRAAQVSELIWYLMGGGVLLLFSAIGVRLFRRIRGHRTRSRRQDLA
jgi:hypothetical protein